MFISPLGDSAVVIEFAKRGLDEAHSLVQAAYGCIGTLPSAFCKAVVPGYTTLTVYYDPLCVDYDVLRDRLRSLLCDVVPVFADVTEAVDIPVCYGGDYGPDIELVAAFAGIPETEVIRLHTEATYTVYMIGFAPGFPYLGGLDQRIAMPRRSTPRVSIPAGSVGIAGAQTGVYPNESPGGWQVIGRTPIQLFDARMDFPSLLKPGDKVHFRPISEAEFERLARQTKGVGKG